ncbi:hypothetical protein JOB18_016222 [Solea senegalensis]|uniref:Uncharacterized protein n=1 Tax=Solea senegalensis TaxID=28829 RepID=A0AAV6QB49_SOLSE|nr:hypothetical protein JOB18_016222 [Solea senegalensis]
MTDGQTCNVHGTGLTVVLLRSEVALGEGKISHFGDIILPDRVEETQQKDSCVLRLTLAEV